MRNELEILIDLLGKWSVGTQPLYRLLADALRQAIHEQYLAGGSKLPPERNLAMALAISRSTVVAAYEVLRHEELVESLQGSGTIIKASKVRRDAVSSSGNQSNLSRQLNQEVPGYRKPEMVDFATGTIAGLKEMVKKASKFTSEELIDLLGDSGYSPAGLPILRQALASWFTEDGLATHEDQILITTGTQQAVTLITQLYTRRGDLVALDNPSFLGTIDIFKAFGTRLMGIPFSPAVSGVDILEHQARINSPRLLYLMPTFQNPTGYVLPSTQRRRLAALAEELQFPIIEDHTLSFFELTNKTSPPGPIAGFAGADNKVLTVGSLSKLFWAGLRVGWVRGSASIIANLTRLKLVNDLGSPILDQAIAARLISQVSQAQKLRQKQLLPRMRYLEDLLKRFLPEWEWQEPEGGLFLWVKITGGNASEVAQLALRNGVMLMPGTNLSVDGSHLNYLRLPFFLEPGHLEEGVERMALTWNSYKEGSKKPMPGTKKNTINPNRSFILEGTQNPV